MAHLEVKNLTQRFGGLTAISGLSISLERGQIAGLIGPNGAGKTTVFNVVSGFYAPTEGEILVNGERISGLPPHEVAGRKIGRTFQNIRLWGEMTVLDNIRVAEHHKLGYNAADALFVTRKYKAREAEIRESAMRLLEVFGLASLAEELPKNLPYGIQRRVEIARALTLEPEVLLLDEPAAGLPTADTAQLISYIRWLHEKFNLTIWMIEHQLEVVTSLCSTITVIDFGKEIACGPPEAVCRDPVVIKAYLGDSDLSLEDNVCMEEKNAA